MMAKKHLTFRHTNLLYYYELDHSADGCVREHSVAKNMIRKLCLDEMIVVVAVC